VKPVCLLALMAVSPFLAGCGSMNAGYGCAGVLLPGIEVTVVDARTGAYAAEGAVGAIDDGAYSETLRVWGHIASPSVPVQLVATTLAGADERPGTYAIRIEKPGYSPWERSGVRVTKGLCNVNTVRLRAELQPLP
jgi:hypothetical protein